MAFNTQEQEIIKFGIQNGKSRADVESALKNYRLGVTPTAPKPTSFREDLFGDIKQTGSALKQTFKETTENLADTRLAKDSGEQGGFRSVLQGAGQLAGGISKAIGDVITGGVKAILPQEQEEQLKGAVARVATPIIESRPAQAIMERYEGLDEKSKRDVDALLGIGSLVTDIVGGVAVKNVAKSGLQKTVQVGGEVIDNIGDAVRGGRSFVGQGDDIKNAIGRFIAPDTDDLTKTALKNSTPEDIDRFVRIQEEALRTPGAITPYEVLGDTMTDATKQIQGQVKALGQQKSTIINQAKNGLTEFSAPTRNAILEVRRLGDSPVVDTFIAKLKTVKNKAQADKAIDELQDILYTGNRNLTIPQGSAIDKQLKGILGKYNNALKESLSPAYRNINTQIANRLKVVNALNKALGEVVDGVAVRGGSLVKQFFSPSGRKAKELFDYVKKTTGVDLAKDATLARYVMELFGDTRANTLLGGNIPTSVSGALNTAVDFAVKKTGVGEKLQDAARRGAIEKAKRLGQ